MTDQYAVIGNPIGHSKSPLIHSTFAAQTDQDIAYRAIEGPLDGFRQAVDQFRAAGGRGLNVTAPFKLDAFAYATKLTEQAQLAGAVNALKFEGEQVFAQNFDGSGLTRDIVHNLGFPLSGRRVLLLGAGGAARGALPTLLAQQPAQLLIVNRTESRAHALAEQFASYGDLSASSYPELAASSETFDIVINATSASLRGELPPVHSDVFSPDGLAYELVYGKGLTPFLRLAQGTGVRRLADGVGMLVEQAAESFAWWRGVRPDTRALIKTLTVPLV